MSTEGSTQKPTANNALVPFYQQDIITPNGRASRMKMPTPTGAGAAGTGAAGRPGPTVTPPPLIHQVHGVRISELPPNSVSPYDARPGASGIHSQGAVPKVSTPMSASVTPALASSQSNGSVGSEGGHAARVCFLCLKDKAQCDGNHPCSRCKSKGFPQMCIYLDGSLLSTQQQSQQQPLSSSPPPPPPPSSSSSSTSSSSSSTLSSILPSQPYLSRTITPTSTSSPLQFIHTTEQKQDQQAETTTTPTATTAAIAPTTSSSSSSIQNAQQQLPLHRQQFQPQKSQQPQPMQISGSCASEIDFNKSTLMRTLNHLNSSYSALVKEVISMSREQKKIHEELQALKRQNERLETKVLPELFEKAKALTAAQTCCCKCPCHNARTPPDSPTMDNLEPAEKKPRRTQAQSQQQQQHKQRKKRKSSPTTAYGLVPMGDEQANYKGVIVGSMMPQAEMMDGYEIPPQISQEYIPQPPQQYQQGGVQFGTQMGYPQMSLQPQQPQQQIGLNQPEMTLPPEIFSKTPFRIPLSSSQGLYSTGNVNSPYQHFSLSALQQQQQYIPPPSSPQQQQQQQQQWSFSPLLSSSSSQQSQPQQQQLEYYLREQQQQDNSLYRADENPDNATDNYSGALVASNGNVWTGDAWPGSGGSGGGFRNSSAPGSQWYPIQSISFDPNGYYLIFDLGGQVPTVKAASVNFSQLLGYDSPEELHGKPWYEMIDERYKMKTMSALQAALNSTDSSFKCFDQIYKTRDGKFLKTVDTHTVYTQDKGHAFDVISILPQGAPTTVAPAPSGVTISQVESTESPQQPSQQQQQQTDSNTNSPQIPSCQTYSNEYYNNGYQQQQQQQQQQPISIQNGLQPGIQTRIQTPPPPPPPSQQQ